jgi:hypothetical protein
LEGLGRIPPVLRRDGLRRTEGDNHMSSGIDESSKKFSLERIFRSDSFHHLCEILSRTPELQKIIRERLITVFAVVDANFG